MSSRVLPAASSALKAVGAGAQLLVGEALDLGLERVDGGDPGPVALDPPVVGRAENLLRESAEHLKPVVEMANGGAVGPPYRPNHRKAHPKGRGADRRSRARRKSSLSAGAADVRTHLCSGAHARLEQNGRSTAFAQDLDGALVSETGRQGGAASNATASGARESCNRGKPRRTGAPNRLPRAQRRRSGSRGPEAA